jgi:hypothetical protein
MKKGIVKVFSKDYLRNELDLPYNHIKDDVIGNDRWSVHHEIIFKDEDKFYKTYYSVGATECQDESPWEYEDNVECTEVELKQIMVEAWVEKEAEVE